jgi:hypothetical protein
MMIKELKKPLGNTVGFIRNNKATFAACVTLEIIFIIVLAMLFSDYYSNIIDDIKRSNEIMDTSAEQGMEAIKSMAEQSDEAEMLKENIEKETARLAFRAGAIYILIYSIVFSLLLKNIISLFPLKFTIINSAMIAIIWIIFGAIVKIKASYVKNMILSEQTFISSIFFFALVYVMYLITFIVSVEMRKEEPAWDSFKNTLKLMKKKLWNIFLNYIALTVLLIILISGVFLMMLLQTGIFGFLLGIVLTLMTTAYMTFSKIYLIECIKQ